MIPDNHSFGRPMPMRPLQGRTETNAGCAIVSGGCLIMLLHAAWICLLIWALIRVVLWLTSGDPGS